MGNSMMRVVLLAALVAVAVSAPTWTQQLGDQVKAKTTQLSTTISTVPNCHCTNFMDHEHEVLDGDGCRDKCENTDGCKMSLFDSAFQIDERAAIPKCWLYNFSGSVNQWGVSGKAQYTCYFMPTTTTVAPTTIAPTSSSHMTVVGNVGNWQTHSSGNKVPTCTPNSNTTSAQSNQYGSNLGVTCCDSSPSSSGSRPGCNSAKTYSEAEAVCTSNSKVLCTQAQITAGAGAGSGCNFDAYLVWTSTTC